MEENTKLLGEEVIEKIIESFKEVDAKPIDLTTTEYTAAVREASLDLANLRMQRLRVQTEAQQHLSAIDEMIAVQEKIMAALDRSHFYAVIKDQNPEAK